MRDHRLGTDSPFTLNNIAFLIGTLLFTLVPIVSVLIGAGIL